jgi:carbamoylphosphate synthase large subunit
MLETAEQFIALLEAELYLAQVDLECLENRLATLEREQERLLAKRAIRRVQVRLLAQYSQRDYETLRGEADRVGRPISSKRPFLP